MKGVIGGILLGVLILAGFSCVTAQEAEMPALPDEVGMLWERFGEPLEIHPGVAACFVWEIGGERLYVFCAYDSVFNEWVFVGYAVEQGGVPAKWVADYMRGMIERERQARQREIMDDLSR